MTLQLTYGDRMGTTNHSMELIKEPFFKHFPKHSQVLDTFINLEMFYNCRSLFRICFIQADRKKKILSSPMHLEKPAL